MLFWGPRRVLSRALVFALLLGSQATAAEIVFEVGSDRVLLEDQADHLWHPASLTKLMTAYLTLEALQQGQLTLDQALPISAAAAAQPITALGLAEGKTITVDEALQALILRSANDAAVVLAEAIDGSEAAFARHMSAKARALGMGKTVYVNASGLPDAGQTTTARDQALLARALLTDFPADYARFGQQEMLWGGDALGNINGILDSLPGADGMKTGFTCKSGYNLLVSVLRDGRRLVAVVLGATSPESRTVRAFDLIEAGFAAAPDASAPLLTDIHSLRYAWQKPPTVLDETQCGYGVGASLPGWGLTLGTYGSRGKALSVATHVLERFDKLMTVGKVATLVNRAGTKFHALLVGLSASEARATCRSLRKSEGYCVVLNPKVLNNPNATWR